MSSPSSQAPGSSRRSKHRCAATWSVVSRRHVNEPFELAEAEQRQFWSDSMLVAAAVASVVTPIKMNYEIHGNTLPHLHLHLFPRHLDDPFVGGPIDPRLASVRRSEEELHALAAAINAD